MRKHKEDCLCASCLGKKGLLKNTNNGNYKDGRTIEKHKCKEENCKNSVTFNSKYYGEGRCRSCSKKRKRKDFTKKHKYNMSISRLKSNNQNIRKPEGSIYKNGYIAEKVGNKWVSQHRLLVERYLGRKLIKGECVHHINEKQDDNRLENLYVFKKIGLHSCFTQLVKHGIIKAECISSNLEILRKEKNNLK